MNADVLVLAGVAVLVLVAAVLLANEVVLVFRYDDGDAPTLRDRLHHGRHARGWVWARRAWAALNEGFGGPFVTIGKGSSSG